MGLTDGASSSASGENERVSEADISALCVECGLCCSGTLFDYAPTIEADDAIMSALGLESVPTADGRGMPLPCPLLSGSCCTVYDRPRPAVCGNFFCKLARRTQRGKVSMGEAQAHVHEARRLAAEALAFHPPGTTATAARHHANRLANAPPVPSEAGAMLLANAMLQSYLQRYFR